MNVKIRIVHAYFIVHFFFSRFQVLHLVLLRRHFIHCIIVQGHTWTLGRSRAGGMFKNVPVFINFCLQDRKFGVATSVQLLTGSLLLVGNNSTIYQGISDRQFKSKL